MLNADKLKEQITEAIKSTIIPAIEQCKLSEYPMDSELGREKAKEFADMFDDLVSEPLAELIAQSIDSYIKNANITGMMITNGSPTTHICNIKAAPNPVTGGKIPNTLGIS